MANKYRMEVPHFVVEFSIPPELKSGYGRFDTKVTFEKPARRPSELSLRTGARQVEAGSFFMGVRGDFVDWDLMVDILVLKFDRSRVAIGTVQEMADFVRRRLGEKYILLDGSELEDPQEIEMRQIGAYTAIVATSTYDYRIQTFRLKDGRNLTRSPRQSYYIRLDDEVAIAIRGVHANEKKLSSKSFAECDARIVKIIESLRITPKI